MDVARFLDRIRLGSDYQGQLTHVQMIPAREGQFAIPQAPLDDRLESLLGSVGIDQLYTHQAQALDLARDFRNFVVVTGTASGKTLCYNLPILDHALRDRDARALYLFPTKALAQDQLKGLLDLFAHDQALAKHFRPGVYDGDTPVAQRRRIKAESRLVLSNPDMLHAGLLPYHTKWSRFFSNLRYVVLDEVHTYRGILGANVACVLKRLQRVCEHYGSRPTFLAASATIANPQELTQRLLGRTIELIDTDGSPRGRKFFGLWNPTGGDADQLARSSAADDAAYLMVESMQDDAQVLAFTRTRQATELINRYVQDTLRESQSALSERVRAYRGGYLPNERRQIERDLFDGSIRGVAATNALELGVDIGSLDVVLMVHYPGTFASTWQQAGRSGRRHADSLAILLAGNDPIDQYLLRHPDYFFSQSPEHAVVDPDNPYVLANHLQAAAFELPLEQTAMNAFGDGAEQIAQVLAGADLLHEIDGTFYSSGEPNPSHRISLRHMSDATFSIVMRNRHELPLTNTEAETGFAARRSGDRTTEQHMVSPRDHHVIANVDAISAPELVYPQAVYLHNGETFIVEELDFEDRIAYVRRRETDYYTQAILESHVRITETHQRTDPLPLADAAFGDVDVEWKTVAFKKIKFVTRENIGMDSVDIPSQHLPTTAMWLIPDPSLHVALKQQKLRLSEGLCGLRNLAVVALPMIAMCDSRDISGVVDTKNLGQSCMILYDRYPGGLGYAEKGFHEVQRLLDICLEMISDCPCVDGCPSCVGLPNLRPAIHSDPDLMRGYPIPNKEATLVLLEALIAEPQNTQQDTEVEPRNTRKDTELA